MTVYILLLIPTAFFAYMFGGLDTMVLASNFVFRRGLWKLGRGNVWLSNFRRIYGVGGFVKLLLIELVKDLIPIFIGGILLGIKGHADAGRAFAGFCLTLGRLYPIYYDFKGSHASICLIVSAFAADISLGAAVLIVTAIATLTTKYLSLGAVIGALSYIVLGILIVDDSLILRLAIFTSALVIFKHLPALARVLNRTEPKLDFSNDITYKLDE